MLATLGVETLDELIDQAVPKSIRTERPYDLPGPSTEAEVLDRLRHLAHLNRPMRSLIGMGYAGTFTPPVIQRNVLENPAWYTAYTPYQPEISQGRLEALLNFQTMVSDLVGLELANASLLDEGTAAAEAMTMARRIVQSDAGDTFYVDHRCHPQTIDVVRTRARPLGIEVVTCDPLELTADRARGSFGVLLQYPGTLGEIRDLAHVAEAVHEAGAIVCCATDLLACCVLRPPGEWGADIVLGNSQRFGVPLGFGGPHAAFIATRQEHRRQLPGRLVGVSVDARGRPALRLALQAREQHIRREKATSNICTAQVLLANVAAFYAMWHGPDGLRAMAERVHTLAATLAANLEATGMNVGPDAFFDTLYVEVPAGADWALERARAAGINLRRVDDSSVAVTLDETCDEEVVDTLTRVLTPRPPAVSVEVSPRIPPHLRRSSTFLEHPVFNDFHSETDMMRYLRRLADRDLALDRTMIPLGSCTMKLNAAVEMAPITWREFADLHPFAPLDQVEGTLRLIHELEAMLSEITGFDAVSLQPNAGSQGEYAGLLAIRRFHERNGEDRREVCLIPRSAHGTNAASAVMAGMRVVVVECDDHGNVDLDDLRRKADRHAGELAALMLTYPSTHGVFEEAVCEICDLVHERGGQVYLDGANMNALVGLARPAEFGADVCHLNLHKTFCIPHGGGGPGVGPVAAKAHLAPFLPNSSLVPEAGPTSGEVCAVSSAPWGSALILPISWAYIRLMGAEGLLEATKVAILNANYVAKRLEPHFPVLYKGPGGWVAHECIIDLRPDKAKAGVTAEDVAKRLMDYGFHAPTLSFPVPGTLMVEPTESESLAELDRFCEAMISIRSEIDRIAAGEWPRDDNPLKNAPHTVEELASDEWTHPYPREVAAFPLPSLRRDRYWVPVSRIDQAYGDRHLVCACPPPEAFEDGGR
ncbi:MAG: glycine dehydrogenase (decarboxylating) [Acidimicrobiales bacterium]|nr:MAG: glycine dehydrogenase (decarboxylating) [Acidimicrobiales bacterium]